MDRQVFGNNVYIRTYQVAAADTEDYVLVPDGFHPALTRDYWGSWTYDLPIQQSVIVSIMSI